MREILFRAKAKQNNEWVYGDYLTSETRTGGKNHYIKRAEDGLLNPTTIIPETVGQYTGLTDKNGTKIFEGDIVTAECTIIGSPFFEGMTGKIVYAECSFFIEPENIMETKYLYDECTDFEVISNIHDNPEMLGGAE